MQIKEQISAVNNFNMMTSSIIPGECSYTDEFIGIPQADHSVSTAGSEVVARRVKLDTNAVSGVGTHCL